MRVLSSLEKTLMNSNEVVSHQIKFTLAEFEEKLNDPQTTDKAKISKPKAENVCKISDTTIAYIEKLIEELMNECKRTTSSSMDNSYSITEDFFFTKKRGAELVARIKNCRRRILNEDTMAKSAFQNKLPFDSLMLHSDKSDEMLANIYFKHLSPIEARVLMVKFICDINNSAAILSTFFNRNVNSWALVYDYYNVLVGTNSSYFKSGQDIMIIAGIGAFSIAAKPVFFIDGRQILVNQNGIVDYKMKAEGKPGKYIKTIKVEYVDGQGIHRSKIKHIEYEVGDCGSDNKK